jgi:hypothetical protein
MVGPGYLMCIVRLALPSIKRLIYQSTAATQKIPASDSVDLLGTHGYRSQGIHLRRVSFSTNSPKPKAVRYNIPSSEASAIFPC